MKKILIFLLLIPFAAQAQKQPIPSPTPTALSQFTFNVKAVDSTLWGYSGTTWLWWNVLSKHQADKLYAPIGGGGSFMTTNTTQTGLTGNKTSSGTYTLGGLNTPSVGFTNGAFTTTVSGASSNQTIAFPALSGTVPIFAATPVSGGLVAWSGPSGALTNATGASFGITATSPIFWDSSTKTISSQAAGAAQDGYLTSTDWNTFNNKAPSSGSTAYIQNQSASAQSSSNFWISGSGKIEGTLTALYGVFQSNVDISQTSSGNTPEMLSFLNPANAIGTGTDIKFKYAFSDEGGSFKHILTNRATTGDSDFIWSLRSGGSVGEKMRLTDRGKLYVADRVSIGGTTEAMDVGDYGLFVHNRDVLIDTGDVSVSQGNLSVENATSDYAAVITNSGVSGHGKGLRINAGGIGSSDRVLSIGPDAGSIELAYISGAGVIYASNSFTAGINPANSGALIRLSNSGRVDWRNSDNSANLGFNLNSSDQFAFDAPLTITGSLKSSSIANDKILKTNSSTGFFEAATAGTDYAINPLTTTGDIIQSTSGTTAGRLAAVATGNVLISGGVGAVNSWGKVGLTTHVSGILPIANGGTGSGTQNWVDLTTNQSVTGNKGFTGATTFTGLAAGNGISVTSSGTGGHAVLASAGDGSGAVLENNSSTYPTLKIDATGSGSLIVASNSGGQAFVVSNTGVITSTALTSGSVYSSSGTLTNTAPTSGTIGYWSRNSGTGTLTTATGTDAVTLGGALTGTSATFSSTVTGSNLSGTNTGDQTTITGNAGTATALQTARNIQGVSFNGTADINPINGTGFVKASGTTLSYDNTSYLPLSGGTLTGNLVVTGANGFSVTPSGTSPTSVGANKLDITRSTNGTFIRMGNPSGTSSVTLRGYSATYQLTLSDGGIDAAGPANFTGALTGTSATFSSTVGLAAYTVGTLPTAGTAGRIAYVTDALAPSFGVTIVGGGSTKIPVFDNGTNWVAF